MVDVLAKEGVEKVFCVPGESYLGVLDALYDHPQIQLISNRHEGGASFMAEAYAKAKNTVGVCMATRGVGASNLAIGVHTAHQDSTPMVVLLGQVERDFEYREAFQEVDLPAFFKPISKWAIEIRDAKRIPELLHRAFYVARSGRPGPVVVSLPHDMLEDTVEIGESMGTVGNVGSEGGVGRVSGYHSYPVHPVRPAQGLAQAALQQLIAAERPIVLVGGGVLKTGATPLVQELAEVLELPVATTFRRFDAFPNDHRCYAGWLGFGPVKTLLEYIRTADVALVLGTRLSQVATQDYSLLSPDTQVIHVDISPEVFAKACAPQLPVIADVKEFLTELLDLVHRSNSSTSRTAGETARLHAQYLEFSEPREHDSDSFADLDGLMRDFVGAVPDDAILTSDAGNFFGWLSRYYRFKKPGTYVGPTSGAMGYGLPGGIGAKLAHPDKIVVSFSGDGGFMMTMSEFETAVRYHIPVIAIVVNNGIYGTIRAHQERHFPHRVVGTTLGNPDFAEIAKTFGGHGERVTCNAEFLPALQRAIQSGKPAVIEVLSNPEILSVSQPRIDK